MAGWQYGRNGDSAEVVRVRRTGAMETLQATSHENGKCDASSILPRWGLRLIYRLAQLERGRAYNVTVLMVGDEPVWTVQSIGKVENGA